MTYDSHVAYVLCMEFCQASLQAPVVFSTNFLCKMIQFYAFFVLGYGAGFKGATLLEWIKKRLDQWVNLFSLTAISQHT